MNQQVNLYQPIFRREKKVFSAAAMVQLGSIGLIGLMLIYAYSYLQTRSAVGDLARLAGEREALQQRVMQLGQQYPAKQKSMLLEQEVSRIEAEIEQRRRVLAALEGGTFGDPQGFGDHLEALATRHVEGTWITGVDIADGGRTVGIEGSALFPELVPYFIQRLSSDTVFAGSSFNVLNLKQVVDGRSRVDFVLSTGDLD